MYLPFLLFLFSGILDIDIICSFCWTHFDSRDCEIPISSAIAEKAWRLGFLFFSWRRCSIAFSLNENEYRFLFLEPVFVLRLIAPDSDSDKVLNRIWFRNVMYKIKINNFKLQCILYVNIGHRVYIYMYMIYIYNITYVLYVYLCIR